MSEKQRRRINRAISAGLALIAVFAIGIIGVRGQQETTPTVAVSGDPALGQILTDPDGRTLYVFARDEPGESYCYDDCTTVWQPFLAHGDAVAPPNLVGSLGTMARDDGGIQVTYNEMPLYYYAGDMAPGDRNGNGADALWSVVRTSGGGPISGDQPAGAPPPTATPISLPPLRQTAAVPTRPPPTARPAPTSSPYTYPPPGPGYPRY